MIYTERRSPTLDRVETALPLFGAAVGVLVWRQLGLEPSLGGFMGTLVGAEAAAQMRMVPGGRTPETYSAMAVARAMLASALYPRKKKY